MHELMEQPKALCFGVDINFNDVQFVNHQLLVVHKTKMIQTENLRENWFWIIICQKNMLCEKSTSDVNVFPLN